MSGDPAQRVPGVVVGDRKGMFGGETIGRRDGDNGESLSQKTCCRADIDGPTGTATAAIIEDKEGRREVSRAGLKLLSILRNLKMAKMGLE